MKVTQAKIFFSLLAIIIFCAIAYATEIPTTVFVNSDPNITTISLVDFDGGTLQVTTTDTAIFNCTGSITDLDGYADVTGVNATFYGVGYTDTSANTPGGKYANTSCQMYAGSGNTTSFTCTVIVHHHTLNGSWGCNATAVDSYSRSGSRVGNNTVDILKAVGVPTSTLNFGSFALGGNSGTTDTTVIVNNTGNRPVNVTIDAYRTSGASSDASAMSCTSGTLPVSAIKYSLTASTTATSKITLTDSPLTAPINLTNTGIGNTSYTNTSIYFGVVIPSSGQTGTCTGFLDISAI